MPSQTEYILRLRRTDNKSQHVLLNVTKSSRNDLDLKLVGTDKETLFAGDIQESTIKSLQERNFTGSLTEWKALLSFALLLQKPEGNVGSVLPDYLQGVETVAAISGSTCTIIFRKNVDGITQRLGCLKLNKTEDEVDLLDWVDTAVATADGLRAKLDALEVLVESSNDQVAKLSTELDMLVKAKREHEDELLSKFSALLNAKKLKIRDQQRLINGAKIDSAVLEQMDIDASRSRAAGASRRSKRKAKDTASTAALSADAEDDDVDAEAVDGTDNADDDTRQQETPEPSDAETASDEEIGKAASRAAAPSQQGRQGRSALAAEQQKLDIDEHVDMPPERRLSFSSNAATAAAREPAPPLHSEPKASMNAIGSEDSETDDDEL